jgi:hypothetical protein
VILLLDIIFSNGGNSFVRFILPLKKGQPAATNRLIKESPVLLRAACPYPPYWGLQQKLKSSELFDNLI